VTPTLPLLRYADARARAAEELAGDAEAAAREDGRGPLEDVLSVLVREALALCDEMRREVWRDALRRLATPCGPADLEDLGAWVRLLFRRTSALLRHVERICRDGEANLGLKAPRAEELSRAAADFEGWSAQALAAWPDTDWFRSARLDPAQAERSAQAFREGKGVDGEELLARLKAEG
jgi:hypothetical protein